MICSLLLLANVLGIQVVVIGETSWLVVPLLLLFFLVRSRLVGGLLLFFDANDKKQSQCGRKED